MKQTFLLLYTLSISFSLFAQAGCTDPQADNYDSSAIENDGSCTYNNTVLIPQFRTTLHDKLEEISGMMTYNQRVFGLADAGNPTSIYEFDTITGAIIQTKKLLGTENVDWECMTTDDDYVYIGDTGNNKHGNRKDLVIYRFPKGDLDIAGDIPNNHIKRLFYHFEDQTDFTQLSKNKTRFDCESIITLGDSIYLFTKDWQEFITRTYSIHKSPGLHTAILHDSLIVNGLVTDATTSGDSIVVLLGSSLFGNSFLEILYDFQGKDVFSGNKRQITVKHAALGQPESLTLNANFSGFIGTEAFELGTIAKQQAIVSYSIKEYLHFTTVPILQLILETPKLQLFPNPISSTGTLSFGIPKALSQRPFQLMWLNAKGQTLDSRQMVAPKTGVFMQYKIPKISTQGQNYLIIQAGSDKYIGIIQVEN